MYFGVVKFIMLIPRLWLPASVHDKTLLTTHSWMKFLFCSALDHEKPMDRNVHELKVYLESLIFNAIYHKIFKIKFYLYNITAKL